MHPAFSHFDPLRSPSWRYERVASLWGDGDSPRRAQRWDDRYVRGYLQFLREYQAAEALGEQQVAANRRSLEDAPAMMQLFGLKPRYWYAHRLHHDVDSENRAIVQAAILARETDQQIAARVGTLPEAIGCFEQLFFNVRDRLDCRSWIVQAALGPRRARVGDGATPQEEWETLLRRFAYAGGSHVLDVLISGFHANGFPQREQDVEPWLAAALKQAVTVRAASAVMSVEIDKFNAMTMAELGLHAVLNNADEPGDEQRHTALESAFANLIEEIPWGLAVGRTKPKTPLEQKYSGAIEPRADEQMMIAAGIEPPRLKEFQTYKLSDRKGPC